jgi:hypothetical protein
MGCSPMWAARNLVECLGDKIYGQRQKVLPNWGNFAEGPPAGPTIPFE